MSQKSEKEEQKMVNGSSDDVFLYDDDNDIKKGESISEKDAAS